MRFIENLLVFCNLEFLRVETFFSISGRLLHVLRPTQPSMLSIRMAKRRLHSYWSLISFRIFRD